ncbi:unnamed protein product [Rotaria sordida]|uniref:Ionotropic glutamate receptor C-terminal domain-containing protein n=1 Tax=Rotaria sordida TaxID=392033 RepID=A0A819PM01_9BILA|nr:unnamed protein product [Rotaria sordida]
MTSMALTRLIVLIYIRVFVVSSNGIQIVGVFPKADQFVSDGIESHNTIQWSIQAMEMFRTAILLSHKYGINVDGYPINYSIIETVTDINGFSALHLICEHISDPRKASIVGIVGPATSNDVRFLAPFAAQIGLPFVSYGATNDDLSDSRLYPTFYRTVPSDSFLVEAIVELFEQFSWKTCIIICEKSDYGYGGLKLISEHHNRRLCIKDQLTFDTRSNRFNVDLKQKLKMSRSRIVLVWANQSTSTVIIQHALKADLVGGSFVWVTTNQVILTEFNGTDRQKLIGLLTVMPIHGSDLTEGVNQTLLNDALAIWRNSTDYKSSYPANLTGISSFAMFTFDAAWILIEALNKLSSDDSPSLVTTPFCFNSSLMNSNNFHKNLEEIYFSGVSGIVQFAKNVSNNRIGSTYYVLYNVQPTRITSTNLKYRKVLKWSGTGEKWKNFNHSQTIGIIWPQNSNEIPRDYILIGVPRGTPYHKLVSMVAENNSQWDISISDTRITTNRLDSVDFSVPIHENTIRVIIRDNSYSSAFSLFSFLSPFTWDVWLVLAALIIYSGVLLYYFEQKSNTNEITQTKNFRVTIIELCQMLSNLMSFDHGFHLTRMSSRIIIIGLNALGTIIVAIYTANLSSFLTLRRTQPLISGIDDIKNGRLPFSRIGILTNSATADYYVQNISSIYFPLSTSDEIFARLLDNSIDAALWGSSVLEYTTANYFCQQLTVVGVGALKSSIGIVMHKDWEYKDTLNRNIQTMRDSGILEQLEKKWFGQHKCFDSSKSLYGKDETGGKHENDKFSLDMMGGLFITFIFLSIIALFLHFYHVRITIVASIRLYIKRMKIFFRKIITFD